MAKVIQEGRAVNSNSSETILYYKAKNDITPGGVVFFVSTELRSAAFVYAMTR